MTDAHVPSCRTPAEARRTSTRVFDNSARSSSRSAAASTARIWRCGRHGVSGLRALAITADSPSYPDTHRQLALRVAREFQLRHEFVAHRRAGAARYRANPANRCYYCKNELYSHLTALRAGARLRRTWSTAATPTIAATTAPGVRRRASTACCSPLDEADLTKDDIRALSRRAGMSTWDEPASACLSSRIPYRSEVTDDEAAAD